MAAAQDLVCLLSAAHAPGPQMREASEQLRLAEQQAGFGVALLRLLQSDAAGLEIRQAGGIYFKNYVKRHWCVEHGPISADDRGLIKEGILALTVQAPRPVQIQLCAAVEEIASFDFPADWQGLLPEISRLLASPGGTAARRAAMEAAHSAFLRFRSGIRGGEATRESRSCAEAFGPAHLEVWRASCEAVISGSAIGEELALQIELLRALVCVLYDLTFLALPNFAAEHLELYIQGSMALLRYTDGAPAPSADQPPTSLEILKSNVCGTLNLYASRYNEQLQPYVAHCVKAAWDLLKQEPREAVATSAMGLFTAIAMTEWQASPFEDHAALQAILDVVLPNLRLQPSDLELLQEDPREFVARDVEGADQETRRRSAIELLRAMRRHHDVKVSEVVVAYTSQLLEQAKVASPDQATLCKDACMHLVMSLAGCISPKNNNGHNIGIIEQFFNSQVAPELNAEPVTDKVVLRASCLKFVTVLRAQIPAHCVLGVLPAVSRHILAENPVVHTYAAVCVNVLTTVTDPVPGSKRKPRYDPQQVYPVLCQMVLPMLRILLEGRGIPRNEHLARSLVAVLSFLEGLAAEVALPALQLLVQLAAAATGAQSPEYSHDIFECIAVVLKTLVPAKTEEVEAALLPCLGAIWERRDEDFLPYCFQVLALLLDLTPLQAMKPFHAELLGRVLTEDLWRARGNVPALVRLLRSYFAKHQAFVGILSTNMQAIFERFHLCLGHRKLGYCSFSLLGAVFRFLPFDLYRQYFPTALSLICARLQAKKELDLEKEFAIALSIFAHVHEDPATLPAAFEQMQPGTFPRFLTQVWLPGAKRVMLLQRRKICIFGMVKLMAYREVCENKELLGACCEGLAGLIRFRNAGLMALLASVLPFRPGGGLDGPQEGQEFEVPFSRLQHAELGPPGAFWDPLPEIQDVATGLAAIKAALLPLKPKLLDLGEASKPLLEALG